MVNIVWDDIIKVSLFAFGVLFAISLILTQLFGLQTVKGGPALLVFVVIAAILLIWNVATKRDFNFDKEDVLALVLVAAMMIGLFVVLPQAVPQLFSSLSVFGLP